LLGISSVAGVGGGMVVVPMAIGLFHFSTKEAIAISSAAPHMIINAFKNLAGASIACGYEFPQLTAMKAAASAGPAAGAAAAGGAAAAKVEEKVEEPEEEVDLGGMFGADEDDY